MKAKTMQYIQNVNNGFLKSNNEKVLHWIVFNPGITVYELRQIGISHQTLTSRISYLQDLGLIKVVGTCNIEGKHYSQFEAVTEPYLVEELRREREQDKIMSWLKRGQELNIHSDLKIILKNYKKQL